MSHPGTPDPADLVAHALGLLPAEASARIVTALAADPALFAQYAEVRAHLRLYDAFPAAPPPPPVEQVLAALPAQRSGRLRASWALATAALLLLGVGAWQRLGPGAPSSTGPAQAGASARRTTRAYVLTEVRPEPRVRVLLDQGAELVHGQPGRVELLRGRAWFEVGPGPFRVDTPSGPVQVLGTRFEVLVGPGHLKPGSGIVDRLLRVDVLEGSVEVGGRRLAAGDGASWFQGLEAVTSTGFSTPPSWLRVPPILHLEGPASARPGERVLIRLVFFNPTDAPLTLAGPAPVAQSAYLALTPPEGEARTQGLNLAEALGGALAPGRPLSLAAGERRSVTVSVDLPAEPPGAWRLTALYRPEGEAPLASLPLPLEIR